MLKGISARQIMGMQTAAESQLDVVATVSRVVPTQTATGSKSTRVNLFTGVPCHLTQATENKPGAETQFHAVSEMPVHAMVWLPLQWPPVTEVAPPPGTTTPPVDIQVLLGDIITISGVDWTATTDMDANEGTQARRRVRVHRLHEGRS